MGIPYSKQINAAFDQVTPLVASAYEVLETTKDIALIILAIQVWMIVLLSLILLSMIGLLYTLNPDLEKERKALVTPAMKWIASWSLTSTGKRMALLGAVFVLFAAAGFGFLLYIYRARQSVEGLLEKEDEAGTHTNDEGLKQEGDVGKEGETKT